MQIPCVYLPGPAPAVTVANNTYQRRTEVPGNIYFFLSKIFSSILINSVRKKEICLTPCFASVSGFYFGINLRLANFYLKMIFFPSVVYFLRHIFFSVSVPFLRLFFYSTFPSSPNLSQKFQPTSRTVRTPLLSNIWVLNILAECTFRTYKCSTTVC
jgi:hypothetical protein